MNRPITPEDLLSIVGGALFLASIVLVSGVAILWRMGDADPGRQTNGRIILSWMVFGILVTGPYQAYLNWQAGFPGSVYGMEGFGFLVGWAIGALHGAIVVPRRGPTDRGIPAGYGDRFADRERGPAGRGSGVQRGDSVSERPEEVP